MIKMVLAGSSDDVQQHCGTLSTQFIGFGFGGSRLQSYFYYVFYAASASAQPGQQQLLYLICAATGYDMIGGIGTSSFYGFCNAYATLLTTTSHKLATFDDP